MIVCDNNNIIFMYKFKNNFLKVIIICNMSFLLYSLIKYYLIYYINHLINFILKIKYFIYF